MNEKINNEIKNIDSDFTLNYLNSDINDKMGFTEKFNNIKEGLDKNKKNIYNYSREKISSLDENLNGVNYIVENCDVNDFLNICKQHNLLEIA